MYFVQIYDLMIKTSFAFKEVLHSGFYFYRDILIPNQSYPLNILNYNKIYLNLNIYVNYYIQYLRFFYRNLIEKGAARMGAP